MGSNLLSLFVFLGALYLAFPLLIFFSQKMEARPQFLPIQPTEIPSAVLTFLLNSTDALEARGFEPEAYLSLPNQMENVRVFLVLLVDRERGDKAAVTAILARQAFGEQVTSYVEFSTRFASGKLVDTMNSPVIGSFERLPHETKTAFANLKDLALLHNLHRHIIADVAKIAPEDAPVVYERGRAVEYFGEVMVRGYDEQVEAGVLRLDEGAGVYRPTLAGAYKMTWRALFPLKWILTQARDSRARQILADYRVAADAK